MQTTPDLFSCLLPCIHHKFLFYQFSLHFLLLSFHLKTGHTQGFFMSTTKGAFYLNATLLAMVNFLVVTTSLAKGFAKLIATRRVRKFPGPKTSNKFTLWRGWNRHLEVKDQAH